MRTKISFKQVMLCALFLVQPVFAVLDHFQTEQAMHEQCLKFLEDPYSTDRLWAHLRGLMRKNRLHYEYWCSHAPHRTVLVISSQLGTASFTFKGRLVLVIALSKVVIDLLPELFRRAALKTGPNEDKAHNFAPYLTKDGLDRLIKVTLSTTQPSTSHLSPDDLSFEDIKARYEEQVRQAEICLPFKTLRNYFESLVDKHNLRYEHKREFEDRRNILTIYHHLGEVSFTFRGKLNSTTALSKVVLELVSELFENIRKDPTFPRDRCRTIDNKSAKPHFTTPYLTEDGLDRMESVRLLLYPDGITANSSHSTSQDHRDTDIQSQSETSDGLCIDRDSEAILAQFLADSWSPTSKAKYKRDIDRIKNKYVKRPA